MPVLDATYILEASPEELAFLTAVLHPPREGRQVANFRGRVTPYGGVGRSLRNRNAQVAGGRPLPRLESEAG